MFRYASVRVNPSQIQNVLQLLESKWQEVNPGLPFDYYFYDDDFANLYKNDLNTKTLVIHFTYLAVFIACLGLFGLSLLTIQRRTKEIGIRKVLGAQFFHTSSILVTGFLRLVGIAYVIAVPIATWSMNRWLEGFVYRTRLNPWLFVISGIFIVFITLATISLHVIKVTRTNPAEVLKYE
jgi:putative ABC transport system permease protein